MPQAVAPVAKPQQAANVNKTTVKAEIKAKESFMPQQQLVVRIKVIKAPTLIPASLSISIKNNYNVEMLLLMQEQQLRRSHHIRLSLIVNHKGFCHRWNRKMLIWIIIRCIKCHRLIIREKWWLVVGLRRRGLIIIRVREISRRLLEVLLNLRDSLRRKKIKSRIMEVWLDKEDLLITIRTITIQWPASQALKLRN